MSIIEESAAKLGLLEQAQVAEILEDALRSAEPAGAGAYDR